MRGPERLIIKKKGPIKTESIRNSGHDPQDLPQDLLILRILWLNDSNDGQRLVSVASSVTCQKKHSDGRRDAFLGQVGPLVR